MSQVAQLYRLVAMTTQILSDLREPYGATLEQTVQDTRRHKAAMIAPYPLKESEVASLSEIKQAAQALRTAPAKTRAEALAQLVAQLERAERHLPATGSDRPLTGAMAANLAAIAQAALGVRYTHGEEDSRAGQEAALLRLYSTLEAAEKTLVI